MRGSNVDGKYLSHKHLLLRGLQGRQESGQLRATSLLALPISKQIKYLTSPQRLRQDWEAVGGLASGGTAQRGGACKAVPGDVPDLVPPGVF